MEGIPSPLGGEGQGEGNGAQTMNDQETEELRQRIQEDAQRCRRDIEGLEKSAAPVAPDRAIGRVSRADSLNDVGISNAALLQNREKLYKLEQALARIDRDGFGDCATCGRPIPIERLMALPESTRCVVCAR